jgi:hypothetical protein
VQIGKLKYSPTQIAERPPLADVFQLFSGKEKTSTVAEPLGANQLEA